MVEVYFRDNPSCQFVIDATEHENNLVGRASSPSARAGCPCYRNRSGTACRACKGRRIFGTITVGVRDDPAYRVFVSVMRLRRTRDNENDDGLSVIPSKVEEFFRGQRLDERPFDCPFAELRASAQGDSGIS